MKLTCHLNAQNHTSYKKWYKQYKNSVYRLVQKNSIILQSTGEKFLKMYLNKLTRVIQMCKNIFAIKMVLIFLTIHI